MKLTREDILKLEAVAVGRAALLLVLAKEGEKDV